MERKREDIEEQLERHNKTLHEIADSMVTISIGEIAELINESWSRGFREGTESALIQINKRPLSLTWRDSLTIDVT